MSEVSNEMLLQAITELSDHVKKISTTLTLHREETATQFAQVDKKSNQLDKQLHTMSEQLADLAAGQKIFATEV